MDEELENRFEKLSEDLAEARREAITKLNDIVDVAQAFMDEEKGLSLEQREGILGAICMYKLLLTVLE